MNILVTFLISTSSNISTPVSVRYIPIFNQTFLQGPVISVPDNLPEGSYQHNYTLTSDVMFDGVLIIILPSSGWLLIGSSSVLQLKVSIHPLSDYQPL